MKIVQVIDTREFEEISDGQFAPIPGSGDPRSCDRCGRAHEVHAYVQTDEGKPMIVGTGCMGLDTEASRKVAAKATTLAKWEAQLAKARGLLAEREAIERRVDAMPMPEPVFETMTRGNDSTPVVRVGDGYAYLHLVQNDSELPERIEAARWGWKRNRLHEIQPRGRPSESLRNDVRNIEERLQRARKSLAAELRRQ